MNPNIDSAAKLPPRYGWFPVHRRDIALIREQGGIDGVSVPSMLALWLGLMELRAEHRSDTFTCSIGVLRTRAGGISRRHIFTVAAALESIGLLSHEQQAAKVKRKSRPFDASIWTVHPSQPLPLPSAKAARPPVQSLHAGCAKDLGEGCTKVTRTSAKLRGREKKSERKDAPLEVVSGAEAQPSALGDSASPSPGRAASTGSIPGMASWQPNRRDGDQ